MNRSFAKPHRLLQTLLQIQLLILALALPAGASPIISEVFYDAMGSDNGKTFVELAGPPGTLLDGLTLEGVNGSGGAVTVTISLEGTIPEDGIFVVADIDGDGLSAWPDADQLVNFDFQNGPDSVVLMFEGSVLDAVGYGSFDGDTVFAGEGQPALDVPAGSSLARLFADRDTDDNALDFIELEVPTPGFADFELVPEPSTGVLMASAIGAMAALRRRRGERLRSI